MALYEKWQSIIEESSKSEEAQQEFWNDFCEKEQTIYEKILEANQKEVKGIIKDLAEEYEISLPYFMGFLDGINESIEVANDLEKLTENDEVSLAIDFKKLYWNMLAVPAPWLFELPQWDGVLSAEDRKSIQKDYNRSKTVVNESKVGRNDPCPCGSGKKYKKCCGKSK
jgi:uncharacterized protein YecA (UPF0149 family)